MPDNAGYYQAAYAAAALIYGLYAASIWWRGRRVRESRRSTEDAGAQRHGP
ncbi:MAG TPA: hypothetical protein VJ803_06940 [Gemmatimonadaceae bacterium]|jgi:hypothetical protein|nr:hypothetical protein [Gemmatimonadaceae bacterium]